MANFESIFTHPNLSLVRVIATALRAHGFDVRDVDLISFPGVGAKEGFSVYVLGEQAADAKLLADDLFKDMDK